MQEGAGNEHFATAFWPSGLLAFWLEFSVLALITFVSVGCQRATGKPGDDRANADLPPVGLLQCFPSVIELGEVPQAGRKEAIVTMTNSSDAYVEIAKLKSSCDCLTLEFPNRRLEPGETVTCRGLLDMTKEPQFKGRLGIECEGRTASGELAFAMRLDVTIKGILR